MAESAVNRTTPGLRGPGSRPSRRTPTASRSPRTGSRTRTATACSSRTRWAGSPGPTSACHRWLARDLLRRRITRVEHRGGWPTLARTTAADLADSLWTRREHFLREYDALPQVAHHGDVASANLRGREGDLVLAIDWQSLGVGPVGTDLGLLMVGAREAPEPLLDAYLLGMADGGSEEVASAEEVRLGARIVASYTVISRAEWALARVATGEGALAAKFRHPSVAPYLRALERVAGEIEALVRP